MLQECVPSKQFPTQGSKCPRAAAATVQMTMPGAAPVRSTLFHSVPLSHAHTGTAQSAQAPCYLQLTQLHTRNRMSLLSQGPGWRISAHAAAAAAAGGAWQLGWQLDAGDL